MRIVFICGSLAPGRDGVGDYTRNLARQLSITGHKVSLIAIADRFTEDIAEEKLFEDSSEANIIRIPHNWKNSRKREYTSSKIKDFKPDWISIQFVIYNYHPKGLPFGLHRLLGGLSKNIRVHIMFHELWIGISEYSPLKHKIYGYFQMRIIASVIEAVKPKVISTSNILYRYILERIHTSSVLLPLFSNIPVAPKDEAYTISILNQLGIKNERELSRWNIVGAFGKLHPDTKIEPILIQELSASQKLDLDVAFIAFGKIGDEGQQEFNRLEKSLAPAIRFLNLGELSEAEISNTMQLLNKGISSTPLHYIGKSGVFAAMKLHNVDVFIPEEAMFPQFDAKVKTYVNGFVKQDASQWDVTNVAKKFLGLLQ
ncbi:hypothetical protein GCM10023149_13800 [Mucilaginibacter gynuensis]|uniref:Glycosyltransferase subfamily 4-like N-terminal domain-containing protein n=1 Tax=Mucilaginibacter gynuensis TaxID=1302236 RepID=A0ABP8G3P8_9SPHI